MYLLYMKKVIKLTESDLVKIIKRTINEQDSEYYEIPANEYVQLLMATGYNAVGLSKSKKFGGKPIKVIGDLRLNGTPIKSLGKLFVNGMLDISNTNIEFINDVTVTGYIRSWNTPYEKRLQRIAKQKEIDDANDRRDENVWDLSDGYDDEAEMAYAAFQYLIINGQLEQLSEEEKRELIDLNNRIKQLEEEQENLDAGDENYSEKFDEITDRQSELEEERDELIVKDNDVYGLVPLKRHHYELSVFKTLYDDIDGMEIAVGTEESCDLSLRLWAESLIDDVGMGGINNYLLENNIDGDKVAEYLEDDIREQIYDDPSAYDVVRLPSKSQYEEIWLLEMEKWVYERTDVRFPIKYPTREENGTVFDFWDENEEHEFQLRYDGNKWTLYKDGLYTQPGQLYDDEDTEDHQDDRDSRITDIEYEIEEIKDNPDGDLDEDSVEERVEDRLYEIRQDPLTWLRNYGMEVKNFIDEDGIIDDMISNESYGALSSYGDYDEITINGTDYVVMRID